MSLGEMDGCAGTTPRRADPAQTRQAILEAAHLEFVENGLNGARVDAIAARTNTVKRMIYYYFGSKERLYVAVLERAYAAIRDAEAGLDLDGLAPAVAIRRMVEFTFDYHEQNPDLARLVTVENIHQGRYIAQSAAIRGINVSVVEALGRILHRGAQSGVFRPDCDPVDTHMLISALCFFRVANRHTFGLLFNRDLTNGATRRRHREYVVDVVLRSLQPARPPAVARRPAAPSKPARRGAA